MRTIIRAIVKSQGKYTLSKGDRLKWTLLKEAKPVVLNPGLTKGKRVNPTQKSSGKSVLLVP